MNPSRSLATRMSDSSFWIAPCLAVAICGQCFGLAGGRIATERIPDEERAEQVKALKFGMFICWSFSTFSGREWTRGVKSVDFFKATGCDTDQWCKTAKAAGMSYILFLTKHHDGFCLWDTQTTDWKVTKAPLGVDVLAKLKASADKYGIKLAFYFSEGDWKWPRNRDPELKCFVGFNHGTPAGRLCIRERGRPGRIGDAGASKYNKKAEAGHKGYLVAEFTYPILPKHKGGAQWFYSLPKHDNLCHPAEKIYKAYLGAVKYENIFSLDVGPNYEGKIRRIDVETLAKVGGWILDPSTAPKPPPPAVSTGKPATASSTWNDPGYGPDKAFDNDPSTRWGAGPGSRSGWLEVDLGKDEKIGRAIVMEKSFPRTRRFAIEYRSGDEWKRLAGGTSINGTRTYDFEPVSARFFRLNILDASEVPTIEEFGLYPPGKDRPK